MEHPTNISSGVGGRHRFDITTLTRHKKEMAGSGWTDVSEVLNHAPWFRGVKTGPLRLTIPVLEFVPQDHSILLDRNNE
jgi:hypothetical protein